MLLQTFNKNFITKNNNNNKVFLNGHLIVLKKKKKKTKQNKNKNKTKGFMMRFTFDNYRNKV